MTIYKFLRKYTCIGTTIVRSRQEKLLDESTQYLHTVNAMMRYLDVLTEDPETSDEARQQLVDIIMATMKRHAQCINRFIRYENLL